MRNFELIKFEASVLASKILAGSIALFPTDTVTALDSKPEQSFQLWQVNVHVC